jgi:protein tyrosine phosphatase
VNNFELILEKEFQNLREESEKIYETMTIPSYETHKEKNRFKDIQPTLFNMVTTDGMAYSGSNYFNGNYIMGKNGKVNFIATQSPMKKTIEDFWNVVIYNDVQTVVGEFCL